MSWSGVLGKQLWKIIVLFKIRALEYALLQSLVLKKKSSNLGPKIADLRTFNSNLKITLSYLKTAFSNLPRCQVCANIKNFKLIKFKFKIALFGYFLGYNFKNFCQILNQNPPSCLNAKFREKKINTEIIKFRTKNALFGYFWGGLWKQYCHIWN